MHLNFQDSLEFSPPRIHSPYYHIDDTCNPYAKDEKLFLETFQKHYNYRQKSEKIDSGAEGFRGELLCFYLSAWCWWWGPIYFSQRISNFVVKIFLWIIIIITRCVIMVSRNIFSLSENSFRNIYNDLLCCDII